MEPAAHNPPINWSEMYRLAVTDLVAVGRALGFDSDDQSVTAAAIVDRIEELRLTLAAEQGKPEGAPSEGWVWRVENGEGFWHKAGARRCDVNLFHRDFEDEQQGYKRWNWWIVSGDYASPTIHGDGWDDTARAAMIAADRASTS